MSLGKSPYVGTWKLSNKDVVQHSPDCLVYLYGDLTVPGSSTRPEMRKVNIQPYITGVSVDAGTDSGAASASISLSLPVHMLDSVVRDAQYIFHPGLEVHIYMRGYFPVRGLFRGYGDDIEAFDEYGNRVNQTDVTISANQEYIADPSATPQRPSVAGVPQVNYADLYKDHRMEEWNHLGNNRNARAVPKSPASGAYNRRMTDIRQIVLHETAGWGSSDKGMVTWWGTTVKRAKDAGKSHYGHGGTQYYLEKTGQYISQLSDDDLSLAHVGEKMDHDHDHSEKDAGSKSVNRHAVGIEISGHGTHNQTAQVRAWPTIDSQNSGGRTKTNQNPLSTYEAAYAFVVQKRNDLNIPAAYPQLVDTDGDGVGDYYFTHADYEINKHGRVTDRHGRGVDWDTHAPGIVSHQGHGDHADGNPYVLYCILRDRGYEPDKAWNAVRELMNNGDAGKGVSLSGYPPINQQTWNAASTEDNPTEGWASKKNWDDLYSYPYYHVFHGVITQVDFSWSGGFQTATLNCGSMLRFWEYQNMSTNASYFGARPTNSKLRYSLMGHNFTGMHPFQIVYTLFHDTAGAAGSVTYALKQQTNVDAKFDGQSLFSLNIKYWEKRFQQKMMNLRMHGVSGHPYNAVQSAFLGRVDTGDAVSLFRNRYASMSGSGSTYSRNLMQTARALGLTSTRKHKAMATVKCSTGAVATAGGSAGLDFASWGASRDRDVGEEQDLDLNLFEMIPFIRDISQIGQINLFESAYESKLDLIGKVCDVTGFEFYQDVDGDFVFKPPCYNVQTKSSRTYRVEDIDLISWSSSEKEPECTYMTVKGSHFKNLASTGVEGEWGVQGTFIDYRLVAQFGWRPGSFETAYFNDPRQMFFAAVNRTDILNVGINSGSATVPLRPELRPGWPIYISHLDCYYYCNSFNHSWQAGAQCTTTLQLVAKRAKFFAPGDPEEEGIESMKLNDPTWPPKPLSVYEQVDGEYVPRISGYPNVVMALDPSEVNPLFFISGHSAEDISDPNFLRHMLKAAAQMSGELRPGNSDEKKWEKGDVYEKDGEFFIKHPATGETWRLALEEMNEVRPPVRVDNPSGQLGSFNTWSKKNKVVHLDNTAHQRQSVSTDSQIGQTSEQRQLEATQKKMSQNETSLKRVRDQLAAAPRGSNDPDSTRREKSLYSTRQGLESQVADLTAKREQYRDQIETLSRTINAQVAGVSASVRAGTLSDGGKSKITQAALTRVLELATAWFQRSKRYRAGWDDLDSSANLLDLLSMKKSIFSNGELPGNYRYFSSAAPTEDHQGTAWGVDARGQVIEEAPDGSTLGSTGLQYKPSSQLTSPEYGLNTPEAELGSGQVWKGLYVEVYAGRREVVATENILDLMFSIHRGRTTHKRERFAPAARANGELNTQMLRDQLAVTFHSETSVKFSKIVSAGVKGTNMAPFLQPDAPNLKQIMESDTNGKAYKETTFKESCLNAVGTDDNFLPWGDYNTRIKDHAHYSSWKQAVTWMRAKTPTTRDVRKYGPLVFFWDEVLGADALPQVPHAIVIEPKGHAYNLADLDFLVYPHLDIRNINFMTQPWFPPGIGYVTFVDNAKPPYTGGEQTMFLPAELGPGAGKNNKLVDSKFTLSGVDLRLWNYDSGKVGLYNSDSYICGYQDTREAYRGSANISYWAWAYMDKQAGALYAFPSDTKWCSIGSQARHFNKAFGHTKEGGRTIWEKPSIITDRDSNTPSGDDDDLTQWMEILTTPWVVNRMTNNISTNLMFPKLEQTKAATLGTHTITWDDLGRGMGPVAWIKDFWAPIGVGMFWASAGNPSPMAFRPNYKGRYGPPNVGDAWIMNKGPGYNPAVTGDDLDLFQANKYAYQRAVTANLPALLVDIMIDNYADQIEMIYKANWEWLQSTSGWSQMRKAAHMKKVDKLINDVFQVNVAQATEDTWWVYEIWKEVEMQAPVFPVSDAEGYTVIGNRKYGRGMNIVANNTFQTLTNADPFSAVDQKAILDAIDSGAIGGTATATTVTIDPAGSVDPNRIDVATLGADATGSDKATLNLEIALANAWSAQELLDFNIGTWNTETNKFDINFQNYLANKNNESVFKVGIENAAYSLADLGAFLTTMESASDLKASEADIFMGAFSTNFVQIVRQGDYGVMETFAEMGLDNTHLDSASIRTALEVGRLRPDHRDAHAVLRGTQLETYEKPGEWFTQVAKASEANKEAQKNKLRQAQDKLEKLKDDL